MANPRGTSMNVLGAVEWSALNEGRATSATQNVSALVVAPDAWLEMNTRATVAVVAVAAADATGWNRMRPSHAPSAPAVKTLKMLVPMVPPPSPAVLAAVAAPPPMSGVRAKMGAVLAALVLRSV